MNEKSLAFFAKLSQDSQGNQNSVKLAKNSDFSDKDADFILKYSTNDSQILDLASGTGLIINKIYAEVGKILAVEPFENFTKFIKKASNIEIVNENICTFLPSQKYDLITFFAIMHYFKENEAINIYKKYFLYLKPNGKIIIKNQFGVNENVIIEGFSDELQTNYYAQYRHIKKEVKILEEIGYKNVEVFDIYPQECNRWDNTHFFAIVAGK